LAVAAAAPLCAQTPLFNDGAAFGGSKVFSEGVNPLGNSARTAGAPAGCYFTWLDGDQRAKDNRSILDAAATADAAAASAALQRLDGARWGQRTRAYGIEYLKDGTSLGYTRENINGVLAHADLAPAHLGSGLGANTSYLDGRRDTVDRINIGGGSPAQNGATFGGQMRIERWAMGQQQVAFDPAGNGFGTPESSIMGNTGTSVHTLTYALDLGMVYELTQGVRLAATVDQLNSKTLWDVHLKPQVRAGLQLDLGPGTKVSVEGDLNSVEKMPFPVKQQTAGASLRYAVSSSAVLLLGAEQRKVDGVSVTRGGATLQLRTSSLLIALGFQAGQDRPMKGATLMVN
jgi:hypothetical protein